jgi:hypothetical protein
MRGSFLEGGRRFTFSSSQAVQNSAVYPGSQPSYIQATEESLTFIAEAGAKSVVMSDRITGCSHEEGIDYEGATCPACPLWADRDRWTGKRLH